MHGIDLMGYGTRRGVSAEFDRLRSAVGAPEPYLGASLLSDHLNLAMWEPAIFFSLQNHINVASGRPFSCAAYYADDPDIIAYCVSDDDQHLATIGAPFVRRLVKICDRLDGALHARPRSGRKGSGERTVGRDAELGSLLAGDVDVDETEALEIIARWPDPGKESQQIELGPYALFYDLVRLIWVHEWAHALTGHVRFVSRDLQLTGLHEFSAERAALKTLGAEQPPAHEVFQAIELHADEFATRYCTQQILWGYDPIGRLAGPRVDLVDRLLIFNVAFCVFAAMWWMEERRYWPEQTFYPEPSLDASAEPDPLFEPFTTTHPPSALRYLRFRGFQRDLTFEAAAQYGPTLGTSVDAMSFGFLNGALTDIDGHFQALLAVTPMIAATPTMKRLEAYEAHLLTLNDFLAPSLVELGYRPTTDPLADDPV